VRSRNEASLNKQRAAPSYTGGPGDRGLALTSLTTKSAHRGSEVDRAIPKSSGSVLVRKVFDPWQMPQIERVRPPALTEQAAFERGSELGACPICARVAAPQRSIPPLTCANAVDWASPLKAGAPVRSRRGTTETGPLTFGNASQGSSLVRRPRAVGQQLGTPRLRIARGYRVAASLRVLDDRGSRNRGDRARRCHVALLPGRGPVPSVSSAERAELGRPRRSAVGRPRREPS
jgi:hypothetical protein